VKSSVKAAVLCVCVSALLAQAQTVKPEARQQNRSRPQPAIQQPAPTPPPPVAPPAAPIPTGPVGLGPLKMGMTKEAVLAIGQDEPVRIQGELATYEVKGTAPDTEHFKTKLEINNFKLLDLLLTFKNNILTGLAINTDSESTIDSLAKQVSDKYGAGKFNDDRKEEQCIYRNGNSFTIKSGIVSTEWDTADGENSIVTTVRKFDLNYCPSNLRYGGTGLYKNFQLVVRLVDKAQATPKKSLF
jgi:hypothetical protein